MELTKTLFAWQWNASIKGLLVPALPIFPIWYPPINKFLAGIRQIMSESIGEISKNHTNVTPALCHEVMGYFTPLAQGPMWHRWALRPCAASHMHQTLPLSTTLFPTIICYCFLSLPLMRKKFERWVHCPLHYWPYHTSVSAHLGTCGGVLQHPWSTPPPLQPWSDPGWCQGQDPDPQTGDGKGRRMPVR